MKVFKTSDAQSFTNGPTCTGYSFPFQDTAIDVAVVTVNGRYPEQGYVINEVCKEIAYILSGRGSIAKAGESEQLVQAEDAVMVQPGEKYYWQGDDLKMLMSCSPAFDPAQHKRVE